MHGYKNSLVTYFYDKWHCYWVVIYFFFSRKQGNFFSLYEVQIILKYVSRTNKLNDILTTFFLYKEVHNVNLSKVYSKIYSSLSVVLLLVNIQ